MAPTLRRISTFRPEVRILHSFSSENFRLPRFRRCPGTLGGLSFIRLAKARFQVSGSKFRVQKKKARPGEQPGGQKTRIAVKTSRPQAGDRGSSSLENQPWHRPAVCQVSSAGLCAGPQFVKLLVPDTRGTGRVAGDSEPLSSYRSGRRHCGFGRVFGERHWLFLQV
jgi:hypothetical protein